MISLIGQPGELRMTVEITRAATGKTETYELVGTAEIEENEETEAPKNEEGN
jgi:hypothetical protein